MNKWIAKMLGRKNGSKPHIEMPVMEVPTSHPVMCPRNEDDFSLGQKAIDLRNSQHWETVRTFCAVMAEQEILNATDAPNHAAACCQRAQAYLHLPTAIDDAIVRRQAVIAAQESARQEPDDIEAASDNPTPKPSQRWMARGTSRLA